MDPVADLESRIDDLARRGHTAAVGVEATVATSTAALSASARTLRGLFRSTTSSVFVAPLSCGTTSGLFLLVSEGNYKDEASVLAAATATAVFSEEIQRPLPAEADVAPALQRAVLEAHDRVWALSAEQVQTKYTGSVGRPRRNLRGIGATLAAMVLLPRRAWLTWVGDSELWLIRDGTAKRLNLPDTLANDATYRASIRSRPSRAIDFADRIAMHALGLTTEPPPFGVTRVELRPGDRVVLGNEWLGSHVAANTGPAPAAELCQALVTAIAAGPGPIPVSVVAAEVRD